MNDAQEVAEFRTEEGDPADDPSRFEQRLLDRAEHRDEKRRQALDDPKRRRAAYLETVLPLVRSDLFVTLFAIAMRGNGDLSNAWPSHRYVAKRLAITPNALKKRLARLRRAGYLRTVAFRREDGRRSSNGYQFRLPPGVVGPEAWWGPARWDRADVRKVRVTKRYAERRHA